MLSYHIGTIREMGRNVGGGGCLEGSVFGGNVWGEMSGEGEMLGGKLLGGDCQGGNVGKGRGECPEGRGECRNTLSTMLPMEPS